MPDPEKTEYFNLGTYTRTITTTSPLAQLWFTRGLLWTYGFNHEEAIRCFERANLEDSTAVMPLWGLAFALGPNYNKPWEAFDPEERERNLQRAGVALVGAETNAKFVGCSEVEKGLVEALRCRYPVDGEGGWEEWNRDYAIAMEGVHEKFGEEDLDVVALYADSLMNLSPWGLWDIQKGVPAEGARTLDAKHVLDKAIATPAGSTHPGLLHLYIHLMEMSPHPESALPIADQLRGLVPDAGHLEHMPTHLDVLCGDWERAIVSNTDAIEADKRYFANAEAGVQSFYELYRAHNLHFKIYAAMFAGKYRPALETVVQIEEAITENLLRVQSPPMADWLESFLAMRVHVYVRFGKWEELLGLPFYADRKLYCVSTAMLHYGRGVALSVMGDVEKANEERRLFREAQGKVLETRTLFNNTAKDILDVASAMLDGEFEYRAGDVEAGFRGLRRAIELSDKLPYDEPWGWMQPPRHAYGALLLEQGKVEEAAAAYAADLGIDGTLPRALQHPNNVWALHGYDECLRRLGRSDESKEVEKKLEESMAKTDVPVRSSCFCRKGKATS